MLDCKIGVGKMFEYKFTTLEQAYQFEICHDNRLGLDIDAVDLNYWESPWTQLDYAQPVSKTDGFVQPFAEHLKTNRNKIAATANEANQLGGVAAPDCTLPFTTQISLIPKKDLSLLYCTKLLPERVLSKLPKALTSVPFLKHTKYISARRERTSPLIFNDNESEFQSILTKIAEEKILASSQKLFKASKGQQTSLSALIAKIEDSFNAVQMLHPLGKSDATIEEEWEIVPDDSGDLNSYAVAQLETPEKPILNVVADSIFNHRHQDDKFGPVLLPFSRDETTVALDDATIEKPLVMPISVLVPNSESDIAARTTWLKVFRGEFASLRPSFSGSGSYCFRFEEHDAELCSNNQNSCKSGLVKYVPVDSQIFLRKTTLQDRGFVNSKRAVSYTLTREDH